LINNKNRTNRRRAETYDALDLDDCDDAAPRICLFANMPSLRQIDQAIPLKGFLHGNIKAV
jgi:hypothetical protein